MKQLFSKIPIRSKLAGSVIFSILMFVVLSIIHISTAQLTSQDIDTIHRNHQRMVIYTQIQQLSSELADTSYLVHTDLAPDERIVELSDLLQVEVDKLLILPATLAQKSIDAGVKLLVGEVIELFSEGDDILDQIDLVLSTQGPAAQGNLSAVLLKPHNELSRQLVSAIKVVNIDIDMATAELARLPEYLIMVDSIGLVIFCLALGTTLYLTLGRLMSALARLEKGTLAFQQGDFSFRTGLDGSDELQRLSGAFDKMAAKLEMQHIVAEEAKRHLEESVASRTFDLATANEALAAEDVRRRNFLADISHELRLPITIMKGDIEVTLREADRGEFDPMPVFERILRQTQALDRLVNDLFLIARGAVGGLSLNYSTVNLNKIVEDVVDDFSHAVLNIKTKINFQPCDKVSVRADSARLRQMLLAVLDNAIKHGGSELQVNVAVSVTADSGVLIVTDNGKGFGVENPMHLIGRFLKGSQQAEGAGLGLAVTKTLAETQGGHLELEHGKEGGALIRIFIPLGTQEK